MQGKFPKGEFARRVIDNPHDALTGLGQTNRSTGGYDCIGNRWKNAEICPDFVHVPARVPPNALASSFMGRLYMRIPRLCRGIFLWGVSEERRHATVPPEKCSNARRQSNACLSCSRQTEERCRFRQRPSVRLGILFSNACRLFCKREYQHFAVVIAFQRQGDAIVHQGFAAPQLALLVTIEGIGKKSAHAESGQ